MSQKQNDVKMNKRLLNVKMDQKFKESFSAIYIGFIIVTLLAFSNIVLFANMAGVNIFTTLRGIIAIVLLLVTVGLNICLCTVVSKSLTVAMVVPINELRAAVHKLKAGEFDIEIAYEGQDEFGELAEDLREACSHMKGVITDAGYLLGEMAEGRKCTGNFCNKSGAFRTVCWLGRNGCTFYIT